MEKVSLELRTYIEQEIIPRYDGFDAGHRRDHVLTVIEQSLNLAQYYDVDIDMIYAIAAYHDTGLVAGREHHHVVSGEIMRNDVRLREWFDDSQIEVMADAVVDHRASNSREPRSIYGKIVAEADRIIDGATIVRRTIQYGLSHYPEMDKARQYERFVEHINEKYAEGGYLKLWIPQSPNAERLQEFRAKIKEPGMLRALFDEMWSQLVG
ncbi:MAG: HD domain-containing protein [Muribaculaceae bacterium]|nr:HD domain-containing protein [Muribaculaceae bacterium]